MLTESAYLDGFDLLALQPEVDMLNFMSYDLHGPWDRPLLAEPGTNLTGTLLCLVEGCTNRLQKSITRCSNSRKRESR